MKHVFVVLAVLFSLTACKKQEGYIIKGNIAGLPDSIKVTLLENKGSTYVMIDTSVVINGKFYFKGAIGTVPMKMALHCAKYPGFYIFRVGNNVTKITGEVGDLSLWMAENNLEEQREENAYVRKSLPQIKEVNRLRQARNRANNDSVRILIDSIEDVIRVADFELLKQKGIKSKIYLEKLEDVVRFWPEEKSRLKKEELETAYRQLSGEQKNSLTGEAIANRISPPKPVQPGDRMPDCKLYDLDSNVHHLSEYKGKYLLLEFWGVACRPCLIERPVLNRLAGEYKDSLYVVGISTDTDRSVWGVQLEGAEPIKYINLSDGRGQRAGISAKCGVEGIPYFVLISPEGIVLDKWASAGQTEKHLFKFLSVKKN